MYVLYNGPKCTYMYFSTLTLKQFHLSVYYCKVQCYLLLAHISLKPPPPPYTTLYMYIANNKYLCIIHFGCDSFVFSFVYVVIILLEWYLYKNYYVWLHVTIVNNFSVELTAWSSVLPTYNVQTQTKIHKHTPTHACRHAHIHTHVHDCILYV